MSLSQASNASSRSRRRSPPPRLGWPAAAAADAPADEARHRKRPRRVTFGEQKAASQQQQQQQQLLWTEKYAPKSSSELAVAPKKVKEVAAWLRGEDEASKMLILVGSPGIGKSTMIHCLARELRLTVQEWTESYCGGGGRGSSGMIEHPTPLNSLQQFLQQTSTGFVSLLQNPGSSLSSNNSNSIILLDELPHLHGPDAQARMVEILTEHIRRSTTVKTVLVYSDTVEGKARPDALEQLIDPGILHSSACRILQIHPPTKARFAKVVQKIAVAERQSVGDDADELHQRCHGDLRFAITTLQYETAGSSSSRKKAAPTKNGQKQQHRDTKLSSFHALGKLLYAKRQPPAVSHHGSSSPPQKERRPPLEFDPERVVEQSEMELPGVLHFLGFHSPDFFTDNGELSIALDYFSDAAVLLDHTYDSSSIFPTAYAASLAGRAVAHANRHPAAHRFRQFGAPKVFDVMRKRRANQARLQKVAASATMHLSSSASTYAADVLPYVRTIRPEQTTDLNSYFDAVSQRQATSSTRDDDPAEMTFMMQEQQEILQLDDIVDD